MNPPPEVMKAFMELNRRRLAEIAHLRELGIYVNYIKPVIHQGKKVWLLGSRVYYGHDEHETFHEFVIFVLQHTLGKEWFDAEEAKQEADQHFVYRCFIEFHRWKPTQVRQQNPEGNGWSSIPDGWGQSLISLAFDVASLQHANRLPEDLLQRLKDYEAYQGARYEISVAAIFARLGFDIGFIEPKRHGPKHCEFIARHQQSGVEIAVEAKSRRRQGVLHTPGTTEEWKLAKGDVGQLYHQALEKDELGKMPFMIFIDVNCPLTEGANTLEKRWGKSIQKITGRTTPTASNPDPYNAVAFTNFSTHYEKERTITRNGEFILVIPQFVKFPLKDPSFFDGLYAALNNYGNVPNIQPKDENGI